MAQWVRSLDLTAHTSLSPIRRGFTSNFVNYKKGCTRLTAASDKVYQLLAQGQWFSPGTPASSTTKSGRHDIAEILLKVALKHQKSNQIKSIKSLIKCYYTNIHVQHVDKGHLFFFKYRTVLNTPSPSPPPPPPNFFFYDFLISKKMYLETMNFLW